MQKQVVDQYAKTGIGKCSKKTDNPDNDGQQAEGEEKSQGGIEHLSAQLVRLGGVKASDERQGHHADGGADEQ
jgi:hypothetical protein